MSHDEVVRSEGVGWWGVIIFAAVVAALFSMLSQPARNAPTPPAAPLPTASAATGAQPSAAAAPAPATSEAPPVSLSPTKAPRQLPSGYVSAQEICPASTNHRTSLAITLQLRNDTQVTEHLVRLTPALPVPGFVDKGAAIRSGSCKAPIGNAAKPDGQVLPAGATVLVTLHLGLPKACPQALPVLLDVTVSIDGNLRSERLSLFHDLRSIRFDTCAPS